MPDGSDRIAIKQRAISVLQTALGSGTYVSYSGLIEDGHGEETGLLVMGDITGDISSVAFGPHGPRDDLFVILASLEVRIADGDLIDADQAAQSRIITIHETLNASPRLGDDMPFRQVMSTPGRQDGPNASFSDGTTAVSWAFMELGFHVPVRGA